MNDTTSNPFMVVNTPSYSSPLLDLTGLFKNGAQAGQNARQGLLGQQNNQQQQQPRQWPQQGQQAQGVPYAGVSMPGTPGPQANPNVSPYTMQNAQPQPSGTPPLYSQYLMKAFGIGQQPGAGAQSPMQNNGAPSPYTNFDFPGA